MTYEGPPTAHPPPQQPWPQEVGPQEGTKRRRGGFLGFMTSLPGVLTALAGLVTAATGGVGLYLSQDDPASGGDIYIIDPAPVPEGSGVVDAGDLGGGLPETSGDDEVTDLVNGCLNGDFSDCDTLLHMVAASCYDGDLVSCDDLYLISAYGSDYEDYGATCGGRYYDWTYAGVCSEP
jgi:hypothetical protein